MNLLVVAATEFEIKPFLKAQPNAAILITGIGIPATVFHLTKHLAQNDYDLIIQAGIGGSFSNKITAGSVAIIKADTFADMGIEEKGSFATLFDTGLAAESDFPYTGGWLVNENEYLRHSPLPILNAVTVNKITDDTFQIKRIRERFNADVESMEGAAFHYVCLHQKVNFLQLRSISNIVGERDKTKWAMKEAIDNLNKELAHLIKTVNTL